MRLLKASRPAEGPGAPGKLWGGAIGGSWRFGGPPAADPPSALYSFKEARRRSCRGGN